MTSLLFYVTGFVACAALIIFSGSKLSKYGDIIAELTSMGKAWFGLIMMAAVTSLPELFTGLSSVAIFDSPDIAVGDIMGSCVFNLLILAILDFFIRDKPISAIVTKSHLLAGFFGILLITTAVISIVFGNHVPVVGWFSIFSLLIIVLYLISVRVIFKSERRQSALNPVVASTKNKHISLDKAIKRYALFALLVITGAVLLPYFADHLAESTGLSKSFVGTLLVAATTSLPELVVSIAAVRIGSIDIAVGNLLGSNMFNILILALDDLLYTKGSLFIVASQSHSLSGLIALLMTAVAGIGIVYSSPSKRFSLGIDAIILIILYCSLLVMMYRMG